MGIRSSSGGRGLAVAALAAGMVFGFSVGCGDSEEGTDGTDGGTSEYSCCINGDGYSCPDKASFDKCAGFDFAACDAACAPADGACHMECADKAANATHDPSDCAPDANAPACNASGSTGSGSCTPQAIGCDSSAECCDGLSCQMDPQSGTNGTFCL